MPGMSTMAGSDVRQPAVAGAFYPHDADELRETVQSLLGTAPGAVTAARTHLGIVAPHAGYIYSGPIAGKVFATTDVPRRVVVLAPNHTGRGARCSVWSRGAFVLPGDLVPVDEELCQKLLAADVKPRFVDDREAHAEEHALEVELPFIRARRHDATITPIILGGLNGDECVALGQALAKIVSELDEEVLVVASSDMSHYLPDDVTRRIDRHAIAPILACDARALYDVVTSQDISMCGILPVTTMLSYAQARGAQKGELIAYGTSGDTSGDRRRVVGYAAVIVD
jgi:AmmeMemoRadiSam system protein B